MSSGRESVHVGRDGWLFLTGGTNRVMDRYRGGLRHWLLLRGWTRLIKAVRGGPRTSAFAAST